MHKTVYAIAIAFVLNGSISLADPFAEKPTEKKTKTKKTLMLAALDIKGAVPEATMQV